MNDMTVDEILEAQEEMHQYFKYLAWKEIQERDLLKRALDRELQDELFAKEFDILMEQRHGV